MAELSPGKKEHIERCFKVLKMRMAAANVELLVLAEKGRPEEEIRTAREELDALLRASDRLLDMADDAELAAEVEELEDQFRDG